MHGGAAGGSWPGGFPQTRTYLLLTPSPDCVLSLKFAQLLMAAMFVSTVLFRRMICLTAARYLPVRLAGRCQVHRRMAERAA